MIAIHIISMVAITVASLIDGFLLLFNRNDLHEKFETITNKLNKVLGTIGIAAGIYVVVTKFGGIVPIWLFIKLGFLIVGGALVGMAEKRGNKIMLVAGMIFLVMVIVQANVKFS